MALADAEYEALVTRTIRMGLRAKARIVIDVISDPNWCGPEEQHR